MVCAALLLASAAQATTLLRMEVEELTRAAEVVARVRCLDNEARVEGGAIWTYTRFAVREAWKGKPEVEITVRVPGGRIGHLTARVEGAPRFVPGEEAVLFLERRGRALTVTGWAQGAFRVHRDASGRERVTQDTAGVVLFDPATRRFHPGGAAGLLIEELQLGVQRALGEGGRP